MQKLINLILNSKLLLPLAVFCTLAIGYLSLTDISDMPNLEVENEDKLYHLIAYFILNTVWLIAITPKSSRQLRLNIFISLAIIVFGIVIEVFQDIVTSYRAFDVYDILANSIGVVVSFTCFEIFRKRIFENIDTN